METREDRPGYNSSLDFIVNAKNIEFALRSKAYQCLLARDIGTTTDLVRKGNGPRFNTKPGNDYFGFMEDAITTFDAGIEIRPVLQSCPHDKALESAYRKALRVLPVMPECDWRQLADHQTCLSQVLYLSGRDVNPYLAEQVFMSLRAEDCHDYETKSHIARAFNAVEEFDLTEASAHIGRARRGVEKFPYLREGYRLVKSSLNAVKMILIIVDDIEAGKASKDFTVAKTRLRDFTGHVGYLPEKAHSIYVNIANTFKR